MKFERVNPNEFGFKKTKLLKLLQCFSKSEIAIAEIKDWENEYVNHASMQGSVVRAIKLYKMTNIECRSKEKRVYLINKLLYEREGK